MHEWKVRGVDEVFDRPERVGAEWVWPGVENAKFLVVPFGKCRNIMLWIAERPPDEPVAFLDSMRKSARL